MTISSVRLAFQVLLDNGVIEKNGKGLFRLNKEYESLLPAIQPARLPDIPAPPAGDNEYKLDTPVKRVMAAYKFSLGLAIDDRGWDTHNYSTWLRAARKLLAAFPDEREARAFLVSCSDNLKSKGLTWNLATIAKIAWDTKGERDAR